MKVYANSLLSVGGVSLIFVLLCLLFLQPISNLLDYGDHPEFIAMMAVVVALDSFQCIPLPICDIKTPCQVCSYQTAFYHWRHRFESVFPVGVSVAECTLSGNHLLVL